MDKFVFLLPFCIHLLLKHKKFIKKKKFKRKENLRATFGKKLKPGLCFGRNQQDIILISHEGNCTWIRGNLKNFQAFLLPVNQGANFFNFCFHQIKAIEDFFSFIITWDPRARKMPFEWGNHQGRKILCILVFCWPSI